MIAKNSVRLLLVLLLFSCAGNAQNEVEQSLISATIQAPDEDPIGPGAENLNAYLDLLLDKRIAVIANHSAMIGQAHLIDSLLSLGVDISHIYASEHGFRGHEADGAKISDETDISTGLPIYSLYGEIKKPSPASLEGIDLVIFDMQDVGVRFYTFLSTLHYIMEACAENDVPLMILDRPNPNLVSLPDGPLLDPAFSSFIGLHPVPVLYGLTIGEYGQMINGEGWLTKGIKADLTVIPCTNYTRDDQYVLPIPPSPNLPNQKSVYLYPSLCFFEGTVVSIGRGTDHPFQVVGHPKFKFGSYLFTPMPNSGSKYPKLEGEQCFGLAMSDERASALHESGQLDLSLLLEFYKELNMGDDFFRQDGYFDLLAGTDQLRNQIQSGYTQEEIRASWQMDLQRYKEMYKEYWIYE